MIANEVAAATETKTAATTEISMIVGAEQNDKGRKDFRIKRAIANLNMMMLYSIQGTRLCTMIFRQWIEVAAAAAFLYL